LLLSLSKGRYLECPPEPGDVLLLIEVSGSTPKYDREQKLPLYAEAGIPECWILNLMDDVLEVYQGPIGRQYRSRTIYRPGEAVEFMGERWSGGEPLDKVYQILYPLPRDDLKCKKISCRGASLELVRASAFPGPPH
jgi:hypothetical protein